MTARSLIVIGAGPKAMAIAAKTAVLAELGLPVPEVHIIERGTVGANWSGKAGYTNGRQALGTSPEKDVGFPYDSRCWGSELGRAVNARMTRYSWQSFLVAMEAYSDWVDRGRPAPEHQQWARYLQWVASSVGQHARIHTGEVTGISIQDSRWVVRFRHADGTGEIPGNGLVITGPGQTRLPPSLPESDRILTVESFWRIYERFTQMERGHVVIVGTGETAAAIAIGLVQIGNPALRIDVVSPMGMAYSRGESFRENRVYSDPTSGNWSMLTPQHRRDFIRRTDRGVFSQNATRMLDLTDNLEVIAGRLARLALDGDGRPRLSLEYNEEQRELDCDHVVLATGADQLALVGSLIDGDTRRWICERANLPELSHDAVEGAIQHDLGLRNLTPRLYLPMCAGLAQGPGFGNLSCLGRLSDRILEPLTKPADPGGRRTGEEGRGAQPPATGWTMRSTPV